MAKSVLNLKLHYKGKLLDVAKYGRDFTNKLYIGSSKYLFWQILDEKFPKKHLLLHKRDDKFFLSLLPAMHISYRKNAQPVSEDSLRASHLNKPGEALLTNDMTGTINVNHDWEISYEFVEPFVRFYTEQEKQVISQYSRRAELEPFQKFARNVTLVALIITIIGLILFDILKPKNGVDITLTERWSQAPPTATKVETDTTEDQGLAQMEQADQKPAPAVPGAPQGRATAGTAGRKAGPTSLNAFFGAGTGRGTNVAITTEQDIIAASLGGGRGGGSGSGRGSGRGSGGGDRGSGPGGGGGDGTGTGSGDGTGFGTVFNPSQIPSGTQHLAGLSEGRPLGKLSTQAPSGNVTSYVGNAQRIAPVGRPATKASSSVVTRFSGPTVRKVTEGTIASAPVDTRPDLTRIEQGVARKKPQIKDLYNRQSQIKSMYGTLKILLYIDNDGSVAGAQITPVSGEFYSEFINQLQQLVNNWRFDNRNLVPYEFYMTFSK